LSSINEQVLKTLEFLRNDPKTLINDTNYNSFHAYIEGYVDGLSMPLDYKLRRAITRFYEDKGNIRTNYYWTNQIRHRNEGKSNNELVEILLETTEEYFLKNANWYGEMDQTRIKKELPIWLQYFKNHTGMFIETRLSIPLYLEAFVDGLNVYVNKKLRLEISQWFYRKTKQKESFHWTKQINDYNNGRCEDTTRGIIEEVEEFFKRNVIF